MFVFSSISFKTHNNNNGDYDDDKTTISLQFSTFFLSADGIY